MCVHVIMVACHCGQCRFFKDRSPNMSQTEKLRLCNHECAHVFICSIIKLMKKTVLALHSLMAVKYQLTG